MEYRDGDRSLYVSPFNNRNKDLDVSDDIQASFSPLWQEANAHSDAILEKDSDLAFLNGKMFYVWEGNHQLTV